MKIYNFENDWEIEDVQTLTITIKAVPFQGNFVPAFIVVSPDDDYDLSLEELHCLMDGIEIAQKKVDDIINVVLSTKVFNSNEKTNDGDYDDDDDDGGNF